MWRIRTGICWGIFVLLQSDHAVSADLYRLQISSQPKDQLVVATLGTGNLVEFRRGRNLISSKAITRARASYLSDLFENINLPRTSHPCEDPIKFQGPRRKFDLCWREISVAQKENLNRIRDFYRHYLFD